MGLHFHDLRREGASSLLEGRVPKHYVQEVLGHANIKTTSTYLAGTSDGLDDVMAGFEREREAREKATAGDEHEALTTLREELANG